jgi:hypothetical protein
MAKITEYVQIAVGGLPKNISNREGILKEKKIKLQSKKHKYFAKRLKVYSGLVDKNKWVGDEHLIKYRNDKCIEREDIKNICQIFI